MVIGAAISILYSWKSFPLVDPEMANFTTVRCGRYQFTPEILGGQPPSYPRWIKQGTSGGPSANARRREVERRITNP